MDDLANGRRLGERRQVRPVPRETLVGAARAALACEPGQLGLDVGEDVVELGVRRHGGRAARLRRWFCRGRRNGLRRGPGGQQDARGDPGAAPHASTACFMTSSPGSRRPAARRVSAPSRPYAATILARTAASVGDDV